MVRTSRHERSKSLRKAQAVPHAPRTPETGAAYQFGARVLPEGDVRFRVWIPGQQRVWLEIADRDRQPMVRRHDGVHELRVSCAPGTRYRYGFDDGTSMPDPASRRQDGDVHGDSCVVDPTGWAWSHPRWIGMPWEQTVIYEVHAGLAGGFDGVRARLSGLAQLGVTAIQLMPIADFPGQRNWGYDGVLPYAPDETYGTPEQLRQLVDTAHGLGMQVFLDVVYNHFGPEGNYLAGRVPEFFRRDVDTPWGEAIDFRRPQVRAFFTENALYWLQDYRFDGLRLDAVHAISGKGWLLELAQTVRRACRGRHVHLILENDDNDAALLEQGFTAQWNDDIHHVVHHLLTGENDGYYAAYAETPTRHLRRALAEGFVYQGEPFVTRDGAGRGTPSAHLPATAFVFFLQNHDQTGNRARGERLTSLCQNRPQALRAAIALQLLSPQIPLLFMGEERGSTAPFLYFTDFSNTELMDAIREGRRREFQRFEAFGRDAGSDLPDPGSAETWRLSNPYAESVDETMYGYYTKLLYVRRQFIRPWLRSVQCCEAHLLGDGAVLVRWALANKSVLSVYCNLSTADCVLPRDLVDVSERGIFASRSRSDYSLFAGRLTAETTVVTMYRPSDGDDIDGAGGDAA